MNTPGDGSDLELDSEAERGLVGRLLTDYAAALRSLDVFRSLTSPQEGFGGSFLAGERRQLTEDFTERRARLEGALAAERAEVVGSLSARCEEARAKLYQLGPRDLLRVADWDDEVWQSQLSGEIPVAEVTLGPSLDAIVAEALHAFEVASAALAGANDRQARARGELAAQAEEALGALDRIEAAIGGGVVGRVSDLERVSAAVVEQARHLLEATGLSHITLGAATAVLRPVQREPYGDQLGSQAAALFAEAVAALGKLRVDMLSLARKLADEERWLEVISLIGPLLKVASLQPQAAQLLYQWSSEADIDQAADILLALDPAEWGSKSSNLHGWTAVQKVLHRLAVKDYTSGHFALPTYFALFRRISPGAFKAENWIEDFPDRDRVRSSMSQSRELYELMSTDPTLGQFIRHTLKLSLERDRNFRRILHYDPDEWLYDYKKATDSGLGYPSISSNT